MSLWRYRWLLFPCKLPSGVNFRYQKAEALLECTIAVVFSFFTKICINANCATWECSHLRLIYGCVCMAHIINLLFRDTSVLLFIDQRQFALRMFWDLARYALGNIWGKHTVLRQEYVLTTRRKQKKKKRESWHNILVPCFIKRRSRSLRASVYYWVKSEEAQLGDNLAPAIEGLQLCAEKLCLMEAHIPFSGTSVKLAQYRNRGPVIRQTVLLLCQMFHLLSFCPVNTCAEAICRSATSIYGWGTR